MLRVFWGIAGLLVFSLQHALAEETDPCGATAAMSYLCGPVNAEDLVQVPDTSWILSSSMAPGDGIYLIDSRARTWAPIYTGSAGQIRHDAATFGSCADAPLLENLITHGLHIRAGEGGHSTLYVVGHGGREAIEVFDVDASADQPALTWLGCIPMPNGTAANSVTSLPDGTLLATVLMHPGDTFSDVFSGRLTGAVYRWSPGESSFVLIPGSELPGNNGIEVSADGSEIYVVSTGLQNISVFANTDPIRLLRSTPALDYGPDNIHLTAAGQLITAGPSSSDHRCGELDVENVDLEEYASCPRGSVAATYDPQTLMELQRWSSPADPRFSNATMALIMNGEVWVGTFSGNRIGVFTEDQ